jgi:hypothetical protein
VIRVTIELLPGGYEAAKRTIGLIEITRTRLLPGNYGEYAVVLKKTPPFTGALRMAWRRGLLTADAGTVTGGDPGEENDLLVARLGGYHRTRRGVYDLLYLALRACGLTVRNPELNREISQVVEAGSSGDAVDRVLPNRSYRSSDRRSDQRGANS